MTCDSVSRLIPLYHYGELTAEEEDRLDEHLHECPGCAREMERQRALAAALDRRPREVPPWLLEDCRADLSAAIQGGAPRVEQPSQGAWKLFFEAVRASRAGLGHFRQPAGAVAMVAIGFFAARFTATSPSEVSTAAPPTEDVFATVRSVRPDNAGRVQIAFDETRRREVSGRLDDRNIQRLLLAAAREENPAVRVESVELLKSRAGSGEVRDVLLNAVANDTNAGVRLKALEGLKSLADDPEVRKTLANVLLTDGSPAIRMQTVDLLVSRRGGSMAGILQNAIQQEDDSSVRLKCEKALKDMNASIGTF